MRQKITAPKPLPSDHTQAEDILQDSKEFLSSLLAAAPYPIIAINPDFSIKYVNPAMEELTGFSSDELIGGNFPYHFWLKGQYRKNVAGVKKALLLGGQRIEWEFRNKNGKHFWVEITDGPLIDDGELKYLISQWVDITERKQLEERLKRSNKQLRDLSAHLESIREDERARISRELHDELGQDLTGLKMDLSWLSQNLDENQESLHEKTESMKKQVDVTLQTVKRLYTELRPRVLDELGLTAAIEWLADEFQESTGIRCKVKHNFKDTNLSRSISTTIFRIFQQSLNNAYRHSDADQITINLEQTGTEIVFKINDNGRGITQEQISDPKAFGLIGMRERVRYCGGDFKITGIRNRGTRIDVKIPMRKKG